MDGDNERTKILHRLIEDPTGTLYVQHRDDLQHSGLTDETIERHRIRSVSKPMIKPLLGFTMDGIDSVMLLPFPDPAGGFMDHIRLKVFPQLRDEKGHAVKYLQPKGSGVRLFFPFLTLRAGLDGHRPLFLVEGEKKALAVAQLGLSAVGFCGIEGWHVAGSRALLPDFEWIRLRGRRIDLLPDGDWQTNPNVERGAFGLAEALETHGATVRLVVLPTELAHA